MSRIVAYHYELTVNSINTLNTDKQQKYQANNSVQIALM